VPYLDEYRRLVRVRALWRRGARLDGRDRDFDVYEYRPQTRALVHEAVSVERLRTTLPVYRIDGEYLTRLEGMPGSAEEKAAEVEAALEFEIRVRGGDSDPIARSLAERLERIRQQKAQADTNMLSLLDELAGEFAAETASHEALGLSERAQGFLALAKAQPAKLSDDAAVELARRLEAAVATHAIVADWSERDDVRRDIRAEAIRTLLDNEKTRQLVTPAFLDELMSVATARHVGA
jgi:type I restriction enzyme, R subunit